MKNIIQLIMLQFSLSIMNMSNLILIMILNLMLIMIVNALTVHHCVYEILIAFSLKSIKREHPEKASS